MSEVGLSYKQIVSKHRSTPRNGSEAAIDDQSDFILSLDGVTPAFGTKTAVRDLSLTVFESELLTLRGPSGCQKTTTLRLLAGLERPDAGTITVRGDLVAGNGEFVPPNERDIGLNFQDFALFPHLTVGENVAEGIRGRSDQEINWRDRELLDLVDKSGYRDQAANSQKGGRDGGFRDSRSVRGTLDQ